MRAIEKMPEAAGMLVSFEHGNRHTRVFGLLGDLKRPLCTYSRTKLGRSASHHYADLRRGLRALREEFEEREASAAA